MPSVQSSISGKVAIITGASGGIGRAIAVDFARHGCRLTLTGREENYLELTKSKCIEQGLAADSILLIQADLLKNDDIERIKDMTLAKFNEIDILINNAGLLDITPFDNMQMEHYHRLMQVNVHSIVYLTKLCIPYLEKSKGNIINNSSILSMTPLADHWSYAMTKAALDQFCRSLALDLGPKGIRVNNINPAYITHYSHTHPKQLWDFVTEKSKTGHALQRSGQASEVAKVVSFLASDKAEQTTGATVLIDGGRLSMVYNLDTSEVNN